MKIGFVEQCFEKLAVEYLMAICERAGAEIELFLDPTLFADAFFENSFLGRVFDISDKLADRIASSDVDLLAFSVVSDDYLWAVSLAKKIKAKRNIPTLFGGVHPTAVPEYVAADPSVDYVCQGEGEETIVELMHCLSTGRNPHNVPNLCFYDNGKLIKNPLRALETDMDLMPFPNKELFYAQMPVLRKFYMTITSKYCPFRCTFCYNSTQRELYAGKGKYLRQRSPENVIEELTLAKKYNYEYVLFNDDILPFNRRWVREFAPLYQKQIGKPFFCYFHPQYADKEIVNLLADAGCVTANMGIQSIDPKVRSDIFDRWETNDDIRSAIRNIMQRKIFLNTGHIIGYPGDNADIQETAAHFYAENPPSMVGCYWLRLYPGTKITKNIIQEGGLTKDEIEQINRGEGKSFWLGGSVKNMEEIQPFSVLLNCMPLMPNALFRYLLKDKHYNILKKMPHILVMVATRFAQLLFNIKDIYGRWGLYLIAGRISLYLSYFLNRNRKSPAESKERRRAVSVPDSRTASASDLTAPITGHLLSDFPKLSGRSVIYTPKPNALIRMAEGETAREIEN